MERASRTLPHPALFDFLLLGGATIFGGRWNGDVVVQAPSVTTISVKKNTLLIDSDSAILCLHDLPFLSPKLHYFARSGPPFVIRSVLIEWGYPGLQMVDLSERENGLWGRERGDRANTE